MILYAIPVSTYSAKVRIALGIKGIDYEMVPPPGGYSSPEYKAIVPLGTIPGLKDGDFVISESEVITEYIEEMYPEPPLLSGNAGQRARQRFLARFHDLWLEPHLRATFAHVDPASRDELGGCTAIRRGRADGVADRSRPVSGRRDPGWRSLPGVSPSPTSCFRTSRESRYAPKLRAWRETVHGRRQVTDESRQATAVDG